MVSLKTYEKELKKLYDNAPVDTYGEKDLSTVHSYQYEYMRMFRDDYRAKADTAAKKEIAEIISYAVENSASGSVVTRLDSKSLADEVEDILFDEIGDLLLDSGEFYEHNGKYVIDVIFGGFYVPEWDGWSEYTD